MKGLGEINISYQQTSCNAYLCQALFKTLRVTHLFFSRELDTIFSIVQVRKSRR